MTDERMPADRMPDHQLPDEQLPADPPTARPGRAPWIAALLPVALQLSAAGVATSVAGLVYLVRYDPVADAVSRASAGFYPVALALAAVGAGLLAGAVVLASGSPAVARRLGGTRRRARAVILAGCLAAAGLVATGLLGQASFTLVLGLAGDPVRRVDLVAPAIAAAGCLAVVPAGVGLALARRSGQAGRAVGTVVALVAVGAALATPALLRLDATRSREVAIDELPYVLPATLDPGLVEAARGDPQQVQLSELALGDVYELWLPVSAQQLTLPGASEPGEEVLAFDEFYVMLTELPECRYWRDSGRCTEEGEDVIVDHGDGVLVVRAAPDGGAFGVLLLGGTTGGARTGTAAGGAASSDVRRGQQLVAELRVVSREEYEAALDVRVS